ncbi:Arc family DNA-binding protein [Glycomyces harbinensis]|uniref:Arc family DNA-binding protein n=1 Tax=Glycomyces harbinensis TaxID=58114 RepID=UPI000B894DB0
MDREVRITLRMPAEIHSRLSGEAKTSRRSLNAEIVYRLENSLGIDKLPSGAPNVRDSL